MFTDPLNDLTSYDVCSFSNFFKLYLSIVSVIQKNTAIKTSTCLPKDGQSFNHRKYQPLSHITNMLKT